MAGSGTLTDTEAPTRAQRQARRSILVLTALGLVFAAQFLRVLLPDIIWYLEEVLGVGVAQAVPYWVGPFALALWAPALVWWLRPRGALWAAGGGLILCRLMVEQAWTAQIVNVWAAMAGIFCCLCLLPLLYERALVEAADGGWSFAAGVLLGLSLDTALRGLTGTVDLVWIHGPLARLAVLALVGLFGTMLWLSKRNPVSLAAPDFRGSLPLIGLGLFLFVEWLTLQGQGRMETLTGWPSPTALAWLTVGNVAALAAAALALTNAWLRSRRWWLIFPGSALIVAMIFAAVPGWTFALVSLVGLVSAGVLLAVLVNDGEPTSTPGRIGRASVALGLGLLTFAILVVVYSISFVVQLPFPSAVLAPLAAAGLALCALVAARLRPRERTPLASAWTPVRWGAVLLLAPVVVLASGVGNAPKPVSAQGFSVKVTTYNIRDGFGMNGRQDLEAIAQVIEGAGTDVVALQEIGRGSLLESGADVLAVLSRRLDMPYWVMENATDSLFGDAILSRYPISASGTGTLPRLNAVIVRGYAWAQIDLGSGDQLLVLTTHLDSRGGGEKGSAERVAEAQGLLANWAGRPQTVLLGDMNSSAGSPEMQTLLAGGLLDSWAEAGHGQRPAIDWIYHTPDLVARDVVTIESQASDHFAVVATIDAKR
jgi:endonuclease/exonuclease/phosphatase family metal-dependent hydrolase